MTPITIPVKENETPVQLVIPKVTHLDTFSRTLLCAGIGLVVAGAAYNLLKGDEGETRCTEESEEQENTPRL